MINNKLNETQKREMITKAVSISNTMNNNGSFYRRLDKTENTFIIKMNGKSFIGSERFSQGMYIENFETAVDIIPKLYIIPLTQKRSIMLSL
jgi:hypothetical protein